MCERDIRTTDEALCRVSFQEEEQAVPDDSRGQETCHTSRSEETPSKAIFADWAPTPDSTKFLIPAGDLSESPTTPASCSWSIEHWAIRKLWQHLGLPHLSFVLWDGWEYAGDANAQIAYRVIIRDRRALWRLVTHPNYFFMEGYTRKQIEIRGNFTQLLLDVNATLRFVNPSMISKLIQSLRFNSRRHTLQACRNNAAHHYNLGNEFYKLWLDQQMLYTCAYFPHSEMSLEAAQIAKMDHVCHKLGLKVGETVVEAGCGWGALAMHMARHYGVRVKAYNVSSEQIQYARQRTGKEGLAGQVEFIQDDWRNISGTYDAFVSVGMLEHVGPEHYPRLAQVIQKCLTSRGRGLIHTIGQNLRQPLNPWIEQRIFPGAHPPALAELVDLCRFGELTVLDVENLRLHYAETLRHWAERFERSAETVQSMYDEGFVRMWRMYLVASWSAFATGGLQLYQMLFAPAHSNAIPRSRLYQYDNFLHTNDARSDPLPTQPGFATPYLAGDN